MLKLFVLLLCTFVIGYRPHCNRKTVLQHLRVPTYDFSVRILDKVAQETDGHFVFSPISTWLQLLSLADGAQGLTLNEILNVTRLKTVCSRNTVREIFNSLDEELKDMIKHRSIFVIDKFLNVKESFVTDVEMLKSAKVIQARFNNNKETASEVNKIIDVDTNGKIIDVLYGKDFKMRVFLIADVASIKANWKIPFNPAYTKLEMFYTDDKVPKAYVNMMNQIGYFNFNNIPEINVQAFELPLSGKASVVLLLPNVGTAEDLFFEMRKIRMSSILRSLKSNGPRFVNVKMPRFNITTDIDNVPELLHDMGVKRMFSPHLAELKNISDNTVYVSMMVTKIAIEFYETGVSASIAPEAITKYEDSVDISFNRPFVFILVDKTTDVMLFAGIYSKPVFIPK